MILHVYIKAKKNFILFLRHCRIRFNSVSLITFLNAIYLLKRNNSIYFRFKIEKKKLKDTELFPFSNLAIKLKKKRNCPQYYILNCLV